MTLDELFRSLQTLPNIFHNDLNPKQQAVINDNQQIICRIHKKLKTEVLDLFGKRRRLRWNLTIFAGCSHDLLP